MKKVILALTLALTVFSAKAGNNKIRTDLFMRDAGVYVGVKLPINYNSGNNAFMGVTYGQYCHNGFGFRAGFEYLPEFARISRVYEIPVSFSYRTELAGFRDRALSAGIAAFESTAEEAYYNDDDVHNPSSGFLVFLANLFSRMEFNIGLTPGYINGESVIYRTDYEDSGEWEKHGVEKKSSLSLTADAGFTLTYRIRRFTINLSTMFHYNITDNYHVIEHYNMQNRPAESNSTDRVRWLFSFSCGLRYMF